ncbi:MAG: hypothetical protein J0H68_06155 [Sphingobacteriia bacterium]|nr:hypothetical protein [Sphingobacteriia bacterium]
MPLNEQQREFLLFLPCEALIDANKGIKFNDLNIQEEISLIKQALFTPTKNKYSYLALLLWNPEVYMFEIQTKLRNMNINPAEIRDGIIEGINREIKDFFKVEDLKEIIILFNEKKNDLNFISVMKVITSDGALYSHLNNKVESLLNSKGFRHNFRAPTFDEMVRDKVAKDMINDLFDRY